MTVGVIGHYRCNDHDMGKHHPESPKRMAAIQDQLIHSGLDYVVRQYDAKPIKKELLELVHESKYIDYLVKNAPKEGVFTIDDDTLMNNATLPAALYSAGAAVDAVDLVMSGEISAAFCATRPPGHHAERNKAMGFCFFNNVAIAAAYAKEKYQLSRVAIVDFDVHHGNGTEEIIADKKGFLFCSSFEHPLYPFSGANTERESSQDNERPIIINTPLSAHSSTKDFRQAIQKDWLPALEAFKPQIVFISAGFDAHAEDEISHLRLTEGDYRWVTEQIKRCADQFAQGRVVSVLEGGYSLNALGRSVVAHINGLIGN